MPEFFLKKLFKKIGKTIKKFANTTIGKIVIGTALFMVAGPAAAAMFGSYGCPCFDCRYPRFRGRCRHFPYCRQEL
jgi:cytochrome c oxidase assembly protein Cox11